MLAPVVALLALASQALAHYTFPNLVVGGVKSGDWVNVRRTNNYNSQAPVTDVKSADFRCYNSETGATATTATVAAGSQLGIWADQAVYHPGVVNVYMAKAPGDVSSWDGSGNVWFKVYQNLPSGQYLVRIEQIALHVAQTYGGAQFYINVTGGGSGTPGPLVAIPGVYTGNEPGILININYPIPANYTQPGPAVWSG
ncbi:glycoside hydrolase [Cerioporus squamosus]|nr:glycoside hydrolase [Cerioporus squamosus]